MSASNASLRPSPRHHHEPGGPVVTGSSEFAHTFFRSDRETHQMRLNDTDALRSVTTIYVLLIAASLGAMLVVHRGRRDDQDSDCAHGDGQGHLLFDHRPATPRGTTGEAPQPRARPRGPGLLAATTKTIERPIETASTALVRSTWEPDAALAATSIPGRTPLATRTVGAVTVSRAATDNDCDNPHHSHNRDSREWRRVDHE